MENVKLTKVCIVCQNSFETFEVNGKRCPTCCDRIKGHASEFITTERKCIQSFIVKNCLPETLFSWWHSGDHSDLSSLRCTLFARVSPMRRFSFSDPEMRGEIESLYAIWHEAEGVEIELAVARVMSSDAQRAAYRLFRSRGWRKVKVPGKRGKKVVWQMKERRFID